MSSALRRPRVDPNSTPPHTRPDPYVVHGVRLNWAQIRMINLLRDVAMDMARGRTSDPDMLMVMWHIATAEALAAVIPLATS